MKWIDNQVVAILGAQWRAMINRGPSRLWVFWLLTGLWYLLVAIVAAILAGVIPGMKKVEQVETLVSVCLLLGMLYWQLIPVMLVSAGMSLELKRLLVYPIPPGRLYFIEVLLRLSTGVEVLIVMAGLAVGLWRHPQCPWWGPLFFVPFTVFNMLLSAGVRDLLTRLLSRKGIRELLVLGLVTLAALPQLLVTLFPPETWKARELPGLVRLIPDLPFPWQVTARLAADGFGFIPLLALAAWVAVGAWFGYSQFQRGLRWDANEQRAKERPARESVHRARIREWFYRLPSRLFPDPLGMLIEKEIRVVTRSSRFRLVFFMGFSFGIIIWLPLIFGGRSEPGALAGNFLVFVSVYAAMLLGEVLFWNILGFDRQAAQNYYILPVRVSTVLIGKNLTGIFFLLLEVGLVTLVCSFLPLPVTGEKAVEAFAVTLLLGVYLMAAGNLASTHNPRPMDPTRSWRSNTGAKAQWLLLLMYPAVSVPIGLAYAARFAFGTETAFYLVLLAGFVVAGLTYYVALESSVETAERRREQILAALSRGDGPMGV